MLPLQETSVRAYTEHYPPAAHLKVIQIPFCFHPDPVAGTEVFVESLASHLNQWDIEAVIAAPGESSARYQHEGLGVRRFAVSGEIDDSRVWTKLVSNDDRHQQKVRIILPSRAPTEPIRRPCDR